MKKIAIGFLIGLFFVFLPSKQAFCWAVGTHLFIGTAVLDTIKALGLNAFEYLFAFKESFLYGSISADILIGKGRKLYPTHSHSWNVGFTLFNLVDSLPLKAYACGYLVHLASDVIAHNFFIPNLLQLSKGKGKIAHILIESTIDKEINYSKESLSKLIKNPFKDGDRLLQRVLFKPKTTFLMKKSLYRLLNILSLKRTKRYSSSIVLKNGLKEYLYDMIDLSVQVSKDCLIDMTRSPITLYDPMGFENLKLVKEVKRRSFLDPLYKKNIYIFFTPSTTIFNSEVSHVRKDKKS